VDLPVGNLDGHSHTEHVGCEVAPLALAIAMVAMGMLAMGMLTMILLMLMMMMLLLLLLLMLKKLLMLLLLLLMMTMMMTMMTLKIRISVLLVRHHEIYHYVDSNLALSHHCVRKYWTNCFLQHWILNLPSGAHGPPSLVVLSMSW
jgi:hypothetical protein